MEEPTSQPTSPLRLRIARRAGESLDEQLDQLLNDKAATYILAPLVLWAFAFVEFVGWFQDVPRRPTFYAVMAIIASGISLIQLRRIHGRVVKLKLGRDGEREVGQVIDELREQGMKVFHDVGADGFNIDHVVVAPQGVLAIETKTWSKVERSSRIIPRAGAIYVDGEKRTPNPIDQAQRQADWLRKRFRESTKPELAVAAVVLFPGWMVEEADAETKNRAWVLNPKGLAAFLANEPRRLTDEQVALAADSIAQLTE
jgi:hypothetical protein